MIALVVFTDGRFDLLARTIQSFDENVRGDIGARICVVDGVHARQQQRVVDEALGWKHDWVVEWNGQRLGFGGTIARAWRGLYDVTTIDYVCHLEDDFTFNDPVDLDDLAYVLNGHRHLAQLAFRRQPINDVELAAGGIVESWPDEYVEHTALGRNPDHAFGALGHQWLEHRLFFTTNPSLYPRQLCAVGWPEADRSEEAFTRRLLDDGLPWGIAPADVRFGYWGARDSGEWVHHIGTDDRRDGTGY